MGNPFIFYVLNVNKEENVGGLFSNDSFNIGFFTNMITIK